MLCLISHSSDTFFPEGLVQSFKLNFQNNLKVLEFISDVNKANDFHSLKQTNKQKRFFHAFYKALCIFLKKIETQSITAVIPLIYRHTQLLILVLGFFVCFDFFVCFSVCQ